MSAVEPNVIAHRRQFTITKAPVAAGPDWKSIALPDGFHFSHQQDLPVRDVEVGNRKILLFGHSLGPVGHGAEFADGMSGRFGWIDWPYLYPDACALFPIYFGRTPEGLLVSSSLALAVQAAGRVTGLRTVNRKGLNWTPVGGDIAGFRRLMRDQRLHFPPVPQKYRPPAPPLDPWLKLEMSVPQPWSKLPASCAMRRHVHLARTWPRLRTLMAALVP